MYLYLPVQCNLINDKTATDFFQLRSLIQQKSW